MPEKPVLMIEKESEPVIICPANCRRCHHSTEDKITVHCIHPKPNTRYENKQWVCRSFK